LESGGDFVGDLEDLDPDRWLWLPGVDYEAGWLAARTEAVALNALLAELGLDRAKLRAVAETDAQGRGLVRLVGAPSGWRRLQLLLALARHAPEVDDVGDAA
jgi:hypothetical protein